MGAVQGLALIGSEGHAALVHRYVPPDPGKMQVVINAGAASLAQAGPGVNSPASVVLGMPASQIEVRITNSNYQKLAQ